MSIQFTDNRDLLEFGTVVAGEIRDDLPPDFAALQVQYGFAVKVAAVKEEE